MIVETHVMRDSFYFTSEDAYFSEWSSVAFPQTKFFFVNVIAHETVLERFLKIFN